MIRRILGVGVALALLLATTVATAVTPEGPRLAYVKLEFLPLRFELVTVDASGALPLRVAGGGSRVRPLPYPEAPSWSRDGSLLAFSGLVGPAERSEGDGPRLRVFVVAADGSGLRQVPGTEGAFRPVLSPDGHTIAFARQRQRRRPNENGGKDLVYESTSVWLSDLSGGDPRRVTPWRNGLQQAPSSFSPDGSVLAITRIDDDGSSAIGLKLDGSPPSLLVRNAFSPVYSPDGSRVAFLRGPRRTVRKGDGGITATFTDLYAMSADGGEAIQLTRTPRAVELTPSWDPSGQRLAYVKMTPLGSEASFLGFGNSIEQINADGTCRTRLLSLPRTALYGVAWQPGPGREAGRIAC